MLIAALVTGLLVYYGALLFQEHINEKKLVQRRVEKLRWNFMDAVKFHSGRKVSVIYRSQKTIISPDTPVFRILGLGGLAVALILEFRIGAIWTKILLGITTCIFFYRYFYMAQKRKRQEKIKAELPGVLDIMVICLGAGLGLNASFEKVAKEMDESPLSVELNRIVGEMKAGIPAEEALRALYNRTLIPEIAGLMGHIIQSQKIGASLLDAFQSHAESIRERMKIKAKEQLMRLPVLVLMPMGLFLMPVILSLILGPTIIKLMESNIM